jgi:hypothetical protein
MKPAEVFFPIAVDDLGPMLAAALDHDHAVDRCDTR